jgi:predicted PurR-regulated permease PerM
MDQAVGAFLRGRLIVTLAMMVMFSIAFWLAGVPYWFLLGCVTGLLSFVPYLAVIGWVLAMLVKWVDVTTGGDSFSWVDVFLLPTVAYGVVQLLEGWLLTPWIQSKSMEMNPVAILIVVLIGGSVAGLYGLLLAIPIAGCGRILCAELLLPKLENWAKDAT